MCHAFLNGPPRAECPILLLLLILLLILFLILILILILILSLISPEQPRLLPRAQFVRRGSPPGDNSQPSVPGYPPAPGSRGPSNSRH